jgi:hypothetical protein
VQTLSREPALDPLTLRRVAARLVDRHAPGDCPQVEPRATDEQRGSASRSDGSQRFVRMGREVGRREGLVRIDQVQPVVSDAAACVRRDLGRTDVHAAVDLARIGADDLDVADGFGESQRESRLAGRGRAADDDERRMGDAVRVARRVSPPGTRSVHTARRLRCAPSAACR